MPKALTFHNKKVRAQVIRQGTLRYNIAMLAPSALLHHVIVAAYPKIPDALTEAAAINAYLEEHGLKSTYRTVDDASLRNRVQNGEFGLLVAVGGDGTMLRASHLCAPRGSGWDVVRPGADNCTP